MLNKLLPSLKSRLLIAIALTFTLLIALTLTITYFSMSSAIDARIISQLETRYIPLEEEYSEEIHDHDDHKDEVRRNRKARSELKESIEDIEDVLVDRNEWIYLVSAENKAELSSKGAPDYASLSISIEKKTGTSKFKGLDIIYYAFDLPSGKFMLLTADLTEKNEYMALYRNRFLLISAMVTLVSILICYFIIRSNLSGFEKVRLAAESITKGDYTHRVELLKNSPIEVKALTSSFNNMIDRTQSLLKEIKEVSNNVAHDLRTPLTRIRGKIETTLMADADLLEHKELSGIVLEECDKLMLLINNMLTLAEYESGLIKKKDEKINIKQILKNLCEVFETVCEDKSLKIHLEVDNEEMIILGDLEKIQRSLSNLFDNSIKYSDEGGEITISAKVIKDNIEITFTDKGCGISSEDQTRIFERFYRVESSRSTTGNGLGLNLAKAFIENHGGNLSVTSTLGKGSSFKVQLGLTTY